MINNGLTGVTFTPENLQGLRKAMNVLSPSELADLIVSKNTNERALIYSVLSSQLAARTFKYLPLTLQKEALNALPSEHAVSLLNALSPDDRTAFLEELPADVSNRLIKFLTPEERALTLKLLGYPEGSVGRLMTPDYIAIKMNWSIKHVLGHIRSHGQDSETINVIYVVDDNGVLIDDIRIRELLLAPIEGKVSEIMDHKFIALQVTDDEETAINIFRKHNRVALPVIDNHRILLGLVTMDDILHLAEKENTEDMQKLGGVEALDEPYMQIPFFSLMRKRVSWLVILFLGEMLTASAMGYFSNQIEKAVVLALFIPLIISSGGNAGSQASTLIIRALALGEVKLKDYWRIMRREIFSGLFLGFVLGCIGFLRVSIWSFFTDIYGVHWFLIALTIFFSLIGVVLWGTLSGSMLPLLLKSLGVDPATSSTPFVATLVDVTGLIIYFSIAIFLLQGTLL
jgi:magnesium transporter